MSIFDRKLTPPLQAGLVFLAAITLMLLGTGVSKIGLIYMEPLFPWSVATGFMLLFAMLNSLMSLSADSSMKYWGISVYSFLGLALLNGLSAWLISGVALGDAESYSWIYVVVTFGFLVFLSMVNMMKKIVQFAEREEWTAPRKRR